MVACRHQDCMLSTVLQGILAAQQLPQRLNCSETGKYLCDWGNCVNHMEWVLSRLTEFYCCPLLELHGGRYSLLERLGAVSLASWVGD